MVRAREVKADRITARVVYAQKLTAEKGSAGVVLPPPPAPLLQINLGNRDLRVDSLVVDVLYAHEIKAEWIQIRETHALVKIKGMETDD